MNIRKHFNPQQPSVKGVSNSVIYQEFKVAKELEHLIHCYWQLNTNQILNMPFNYRVVSDGCVDVFFDLNDTSASSAMGFCKKYTQFPLSKDFNYGGVRFYPSVFPYLFDISAKELVDKYLPLHTVAEPLAAFIAEKVNLDFKNCLSSIDNYFLELYAKKTDSIDTRFQNAFSEILLRKGNIETEKELDIGLSPRQLRRLFNYYIGTTPKSFAQVVRFQHILSAKLSLEDFKKNKIFFDVGFYDQAHFIKNFKQFYGVTPTEAFD